MMGKFFSFLVAALVLAAVCAGPSWAQVTTATVRGVVTDTSGAVLPAVRVTVKNVGTGVTRTAPTDGSGVYEIASLPPGNYELAAELAGFKRFVRSGIELSGGQEVALPLTMQLGEVTEQVEVTAAAPLVETENSAVSGLVEGGTVRNMPLNGRSYDQLVLLNPGVTAYNLGGQNLQNGPGVKMSISGGRPESTYFMLDGTNILDHSNFTPGSAAGNNLGVDAIQEFRVFTHNFSAEIGVRGAAAVSIVSRSGGNQFHGSGFEFYRNSAMDARNFFDGSAPPPFNRHQFGGSVGGPIRRDKTFFFANVEHLRERLGRTLVGTVPSAPAHQGILPGQPQINVPQAVKPYLDLYPLPNGQDFKDGTGELRTTFTQPTDETYLMGRVDHRLAADALFVRYTFDNAEVLSATNAVTRWRDSSKTRSQFVTLQETHIFRQNLLNEFRGAFNRTNPKQDNMAMPPTDPALKFLDFAREMGGIQFQVGRGSSGGVAITGIGAGGNVPRIFTQNVYQFSDNVSHRVGRNSLRYGVDVQRIQFNAILPEQSFGTYSFSSLANFLRGLPTSVDAPKPDSDAQRAFRQSLLGMYLQNDFKFRPNLTLNLGLRYEFTTIPSEDHGKLSNLVNILDPAARIGFLLNRNASLHDFGPRFGFAWDPRGNGKTAVRGGAGVYYSQVMGRNYYTYALKQSPFMHLTTITPNPPFPHPFVSGIANIPVENDRIDPNLQTPTTYQYSLTIERQFLGNWAMEIGYVGSHGVHLLRNAEANIAFPSDDTPFYPPGSQPRNPNFGPIFNLTSDSLSSYHSLQTSLKKRMSRGLTFQTTYTFGKSLDDASTLQRGQGSNTPSFTQNPNNRRADRGRSSFNIAHSFTLNFSYDVPRLDTLPAAGRLLVNGWQLGGIARISSGTPFTAETGFNRSRDRAPTVADRPNLTPGFSNNPTHGVTQGCAEVPAGLPLGTPDKWFDPCAFFLPPPGFYGNAGRDTLTGPGLATFDLSLVRRFPIGKREGMGLSFRAEAFNLLNRANFGLPVNRVFNSQEQRPGSVGRISTTITSSRQLQLGLKFTF